MSKDIVNLRGDTRISLPGKSSRLCEEGTYCSEILIYERILITLDSEEEIPLPPSSESSQKDTDTAQRAINSFLQSKESGIESGNATPIPLVTIDMEDTAVKKAGDKDENEKSQDFVQSSMPAEESQSKDDFLGFKNIVASKFTAMKLKQEQKKLTKIDKDISMIVNKMSKKRESLLSTSSSKNAKQQEKCHKEVSKAAETVALLEIDRDAQDMKIQRLKDIMANRGSLTVVAKRKFTEPEAPTTGTGVVVKDGDTLPGVNVVNT